MKKIIVLILVSGTVFGGLLFTSNLSAEREKGTNSNLTEEYEDTLEKNTVDDPVVVRIPSLNIEVNVERVEQDEEGRMDVPSRVDNAAWYGLGVRPGEQGNAVIAAHYDTPTGDPSVFYSLNTLDAGDRIEVEDENGNLFVYSVISIEEHPTNQFPLQEVFGSSDGYFLNLITCGGTWNEAEGTYDTRTVVYSELIDV